MFGLFSSKKSKEKDSEEKKDQEQETGQKKAKSYKEQIEENVEFYHMPRDVKLGRPKRPTSRKVKESSGQEGSSPKKEKAESKAKEENKKDKKTDKIQAVSGEETDTSTDNRTKVVGVIIMVLGVVLMGGAIYLGYAYFVAPAMNPSGEEETKQEEEKEKESSQPEEQDKEEQEKEEEEEPENKKEEEEQKEEEPEEEATTTPEEEATSTPEEATTTPEEEATSTPEEATSTTPDFADSDEDGLFDAEEELLGSDSESADSDNDGYDDETELVNLYNPAQKKPRKLINNPNISEYTNTKLGYKFLRPSDWREQETNNGRGVVLQSGEGIFLTVAINDNSEGQSVKEWYRETKRNNITDPDKESAIPVIEKNNWKAVAHESKSIFYLTGEDKERIYALTLSSQSGEAHLKYENILGMVLNSFQLQ